MPKVSSHLWFEKGAREAAAFYVSLVPGSMLVGAAALPADTPSGPANPVVVVEFTLAGQNFVAMEAGPHDPFNDAFSIQMECEDQTEIDRIWHAIRDHGGREVMCGWITDRWGVRWQILPTGMSEMLGAPDRAGARRATEAMLKMVKIDLATLQRAFAGD